MNIYVYHPFNIVSNPDHFNGSGNSYYDMIGYGPCSSKPTEIMGKYLLFVGYGYSEYGSPQSYPNKTDPKHCLK